MLEEAVTHLDISPNQRFPSPLAGHIYQVAYTTMRFRGVLPSHASRPSHSKQNPHLGANL